MTLPRTVSDVVAEHTVFEIECIERMYLNVYVPQLQYPAGIVGYVHRQLGLPIASTAPLGKITDAFSTAIRRFAFDEQVPWVDFAKGSARARAGRSALLRRTAERRRRARHLRPANPRTREAIALTVAAVDDCSYCKSAHTAGGKGAGLAGEEMIAILQGIYDADSKLAALLAVTREATASKGTSQTAPGRPPSTQGERRGAHRARDPHHGEPVHQLLQPQLGTEPDVPAAPDVDSEPAA